MDFVTFLGLAASIGVPAIGGILTAGKLWQMVNDQGADIVDLRERVGKAEDAALQAKDAAGQVVGLATAIEHLGERVADQIKHMSDTFALETGHTRAQLADIKEDLRSVRAPARARRSSDA